MESGIQIAHHASLCKIKAIAAKAAAHVPLVHFFNRQTAGRAHEMDFMKWTTLLRKETLTTHLDLWSLGRSGVGGSEKQSERSSDGQIRCPWRRRWLLRTLHRAASQAWCLQASGAMDLRLRLGHSALLLFTADLNEWHRTHAKGACQLIAYKLRCTGCRPENS
jgi:hypothetical protein